MRAIPAAALLVACVLAGCASPPWVNRSSTTTGDAFGYDAGTAGTGTSPAAGTTTRTATTTPAPVPTTSTRPPGAGGAAQDTCAGKTRDGLALRDASHTVVAISTGAGCLVAELHDDKAPLTVANFVRYVEEGFYDGTQFYRIEPGFVNQGGGERQGKTGQHPPVRNEATASGLTNDLHTLSMARTSHPDSATTEFFVNQDDNCFLDPPSTSSCPGNVVSPDGYAVFGFLVEGGDVSDRINAGGVPVGIHSIRVLA